MAGWYDDAWAFRAPITHTGGAGTVDYLVTIPSSLDVFWENVQSDGDDIRLVYSDGSTNYAYQLVAGFNATTRTGSFYYRITAGPTSGRVVWWVYWGNAAATTGSSALGIVSGGAVLWPMDAPVPSNTVSWVQESPDATQPGQTVRKGSADVIFAYVDVTDTMTQRATPSQGSVAMEGVRTIVVTATLAGVDATATVANSPQYHALVEHNGRQYVRVYLHGGTSGNTYTVIVTCTTLMNANPSGTFDQRTITMRFLLDVYDVSEV